MLALLAHVVPVRPASTCPRSVVEQILGCGTSTLRTWDKNGSLVAVRTPGGQRRYRTEDLDKFQGITKKTSKKSESVAVYSRVSSHEQKAKGDLDRQKGRLLEHCVKQSYSVTHVMEEVGSGMTDTRPKMLRLLDVVAATSSGHVFGADLKPKFNKLYDKVREVRANRQRQDLKENSPRLDRLESKLSGLTKSITGRVSNELVKRYPDSVFVLEDLDLSGCRGQKRFCYRALAHALESKVPTEKVNPAYSSQTCPSCGHVSRMNRSGTSFFCRQCGRRSHADVVGGINLLRRSENKQIGLDDHPSEVKRMLVRLYWDRGNLDRECPQDFLNKYAPLPYGRRLTTRGHSRKRSTGIAFNQAELQPHPQRC